MASKFMPTQGQLIGFVVGVKAKYERGDRKNGLQRLF